MPVDVEVLSERYGPMVLRRCRTMLADDDRALDAMQETFVKLLVHQDRLDERAPASLLYRTATRVCLNRIRTRQRHPEDADEGLLQKIANADEPEGNTVARFVLGRLFGREVESTRTIAVLHYVDGMTLAEVAREVGMSVSGVRKRLRRLRANLHDLDEA